MFSAIKFVFLILLTIIAFWIIYRTIYLQIKRWLYRKAFSNIYTHSEIQLPKLKSGYSYSWPSFTVTFTNKDQFDFAVKKGLNKKFKEEIHSIYKDLSEFDAGHAVYFTWMGRTSSRF